MDYFMSRKKNVNIRVFVCKQKLTRTHANKITYLYVCIHGRERVRINMFSVALGNVPLKRSQNKNEKIEIQQQYVHT